MLLLCIFKQFFVPYGYSLNRVGVKFLTSNQRTKHTCTMSSDGSPKEKQFMNNLPKKNVSRNGAYPKFKVLVHFWLDQIYPLKTSQNIAKS